MRSSPSVKEDVMLKVIHIIRSQKGAFTIAELMVALAISSIVMAALVAFLIQGTDIFKFSDTQVEVQRKARIALIRMTKEIRGATSITRYQYRIVITGVTVTGENLPAGDNQLDYTPISNTEPILYDGNDTPIASSNYNIKDQTTGEIAWQGAYVPSRPVTADYTCNRTITYSITHSSDATLSRNDGTKDEVLAYHVRNLRERPTVPIFTISNGRVNVNLIIDVNDEDSPPQPYSVKTEVKAFASLTDGGGGGLPSNYPGPVYGGTPTALWNLNEGSGQVANSEPVGNNLTLGSTPSPDGNDPSWQLTAAPEYALYFNGTSDSSTASYLYIEDSGHETRDDLDVEQITIEAWVSPSTGSRGGSDRVILAKPSAYGLWIDSQGYLNAYLSVEPFGDWLQATTQSGSGGVKVPEGEWSFVTMTYDKSSLKLYIDGVDRTGESMPGGDCSIVNSFLPLRIGVGQNFPGSPDTFLGLIDKVAIYRSAKSETEIGQDAGIL